MNKCPYPTGWSKALSLLTVLVLSFSLLLFFHPNIFAADDIIGRNSISSRSDSSSNNSRGQILDKGSARGSFRTGFDSSVPPSWSAWSQRPAGRTIDPYAGYKKLAYDPSYGLPNLTGFSLETTDDGGSLIEKTSGILNTVTNHLRLAQETAELDPGGTLSGMSDQVEGMFGAVEKAYADADVMFQEVDVMYAALDGNYKGVENVEITQDVTSRFNKASDAMADRALLMRKSVDHMVSAIADTFQDLDGYVTALDHMSKDGAAAVKFAGELSGKMDESAKVYQTLTGTLKSRNIEKAGNDTDVLQYFNDQKGYLKSLAAYVQKDQLGNVEEVRTYLSGARSYLEKAQKDLTGSGEKLKEIESYLRKAKIWDVQGRDFFEVSGGGDVCASAETKGLKSLKECSKSCRTVCRWKSKEAGNDCYECPSGSPDSCYDVKAWPADHPWCQPGGVCYEDPMMYCVPFGATGPNLEKLQCTTCKQRPDMCAQKVGGGMTLTNCKLGCWNGKCVYKGKYEEFEWDGKAEHIHCYECMTPPAPPTCEDKGWGYDWEADCKRSCPAPGTCEEVTMPGGNKKGAAPPAGGDQGNGGEDGKKDGPQGPGGDSEGRGPGGTPAGEGGSKPTPPTGTPEQPGGGAAVAGGGSKAEPGTVGGDQPSQENPKKPEGQPDTTHSKTPPVPEGQKPDIEDTSPPDPPDTAQTTWLRKWIAEDDAIIADRNKIIADPHEGYWTKAEAASQVESYTKERERLNKWLEEEQERERARLQKEEDDKARSEAGRAERERTRTRWRDSKDILKEIKTRELKESLDRMKTRLTELQDMLKGRKEHIDRLDSEINLLEREIQHHKDASESGSKDATHAKETIAALEKELVHKKGLRNELAKKLQEAQRQASEEFQALKRDYQKKLYAVDENARRQEEAIRIDQYYDKYMELEQTKASRDERNRQFEEKFKDMESQIADAKTRGDTDTAEKLQEQLDNMKRGKADWDKQYETRIKNLEDELYHMGYRENFDMGVGPSDKESLISHVHEYAKIMDDHIGAVEKKIAELEQSGGTQSAGELDKLKERLNQLRESRAALQEKQDTLKNGYTLPDDIKENIQANTDRYAEGAKNVGPDKSFARLALESLGEEYVHNLNPAVMAKKSVAFAWGVVKGVGTAVKDLAVLGVGLADLSYELQAQALGFEDGGIFGTDASEKLYGVLNTVYDNANFDGVVKAVVAAGGALDAELKKIEKSGDIDWAASELGGNVVGQTVVGDVVIGSALGKAGSLLGLTNEAADVANAAKKAGNLADDMADASRAASKAVDELPPASSLPDSAPAPKTAPHETPPSRGPPAPTVYDNAKPLPDSGRKPTPLPDETLATIEKNQGFRQDHAQRMNEFAQEKGVYLLVRDGNPDSVKFFDDPDMMSKPMSSKAKTAKVGPDQGLVVNPVHPKQAQYWDEAIARAKKSGNLEEVAWLEKNRAKAVETWNKYAIEMLNDGYQVNPATGVVEYIEVLPDGSTKVWKGIHGDYDLHGVYRQGPDGMESVSFGEGQKFDANGVDRAGSTLRRQLNDKLTGGAKDMVNHGGQDDWIPDPHKVPNKPPDPPVTVFGPNGGPPVQLKTAQEMKDFYENVMGVKWPYPDPLKPVVTAANTATKAAEVAKPAVTNAGSVTQKFNDVIPPPGAKTQTFDNVLKTPESSSGVGKAQDTIPPTIGPDMPVQGGTRGADDIPPTIDGRPRASSADDVTIDKPLRDAGDGTIAPPVEQGIPFLDAPPLQSNGSARFKAPDGTEVPVNTGDRLGGGLTSSAYVNADNTKQVIRVTDMGGRVPQAVNLDKSGRTAVNNVEKALGENSPIRVVKQHQRFEVNDPTSPLHNKAVEVVERAEQGTAKTVLAENGGVMSDGQARAFDQATRALNDQGYAWLDSHSGNYTFEQMPGGGPDDWRIVIIDPGGIVPMKGTTVAEKATNARAIQARINAPEESFQKLMKYVEKSEDRIQASVLGEERNFILEAHGQNIDMGAMNLADNPQLVAFNPGGALKHPKVQQLFNMSAEEAAKFGK